MAYGVCVCLRMCPSGRVCVRKEGVPAGLCVCLRAQGGVARTGTVPKGKREGEPRTGKVQEERAQPWGRAAAARSAARLERVPGGRAALSLPVLCWL